MRPAEAFGGGLQHRLHDIRVAGAAAQVARQHLAYFELARVRIALQVIGAGHQDARGAEAALQRVVAAERLLQVGQAVDVLVQALDGIDLAAFGLYGQRHTGAAGHAVDVHGAGAADAVLAADVGAGRAQFVSEEVRQQGARFAGAAALLAIEYQVDAHDIVFTVSLHH